MIVSLYSCTRHSPHYQKSIIPTNYESQKNIIWQKFAMIHSPYGSLSVVILGYDRNRDRPVTRSIKSGRKGIDLLEAKLFNRSGHWNWYPFLILSDENYDGTADHLFLDSNLDGLIDTSDDIAPWNLAMDKIQFDTFKPWEKLSSNESTPILDPTGD